MPCPERSGLRERSHPSVCLRQTPTGCGSRIMLRALGRRLHSATAAPASSRCIRRRRRSTSQPLKGRLLLYNPSKAPLSGELDAPQAQTEGFCCPAALHLPGHTRGGVKTPPYKPTKTGYFVFDGTAGCGRENIPVCCAFREVQNPSVCFADTSPTRGGFYSTTRQRLPFRGRGVERRLRLSMLLLT